MRILIVLALLLLALAGLTALSNLSANWHFVVSAPAGELLYTATFDDLVDEWSLYEGRLSAQVVAEQLRINVDTVQSAPFSTAAPYFSDFDVRVQARAVGGPVNNGYGIIFRVQRDKNHNPLSYYFFLVSSDGYYQVQQVVDGGQKELSTWIPSPLIRQGLDADNWLRVVAVGDQFQFFINGEQVELCIPNSPDGISTYVTDCVDGEMQATLIDDSIPDGQIGVVAMTLDEPGVEVAYDTMVVYGPEAIDE